MQNEDKKSESSGNGTSNSLGKSDTSREISNVVSSAQNDFPYCNVERFNDGSICINSDRGDFDFDTQKDFQNWLDIITRLWKLVKKDEDDEGS